MSRRRRIVLGLLLVAGGLPLAAVLAAMAFLAALNPLVLGGSRQPGRTMISGGRTRQYLLHLPHGHPPAGPAPLVICLHGAMLWPSTQMAISRWNERADREGFVVAYPAGIASRPLPFLPALPIWPLRPAGALQADVRFIADLIAELERTYAIDRDRIYVSGFSNGGGMAFALSCTLADRIAAVGTVAAAESLPWSWCRERRPMPLIAFHGTADRLVPYDGGASRAGRLALSGARQGAAAWARRNGCRPGAVESVVAPDVTSSAYTGCADDASVVLYTVRDGGHSWPGGGRMPAWLVGRTSRDIDATGLMWAFFRQHRLRRAP